MTSTGSALGLGLICIDGEPAMTLLVVQGANVAGEEERQVLNETDFTCVISGLQISSIKCS